MLLLVISLSDSSACGRIGYLHFQYYWLRTRPLRGKVTAGYRHRAAMMQILQVVTGKGNYDSGFTIWLQIFGRYDAGLLLVTDKRRYDDGFGAGYRQKSVMMQGLCWPHVDSLSDSDADYNVTSEEISKL